MMIFLQPFECPSRYLDGRETVSAGWAGCCPLISGTSLSYGEEFVRIARRSVSDVRWAEAYGQQEHLPLTGNRLLPH